MKVHSKKKKQTGQLWLNVFFIILTLCYIIPIFLAISISFEGERNQWFSLLPHSFSLAGYKMVFARPEKIIRAYLVTFFYTSVATIGSLLVESLYAYPLSKRDFKYRKAMTFILFFTTLFNGGIVASYVINTNVLKLGNSIWIYILPALMNAWNVIIIRTFFQGLPGDIFEAARIDGASELLIFVKMVLPLSKPVLASIGFLTFISLWNNWTTTQVYIRDPNLYSLQYLLKLIIDNEERLKQMATQGGLAMGLNVASASNLESMRFAMAVIAAGPICFLFPFLQKYFAKGMTLGSVKG